MNPLTHTEIAAKLSLRRNSPDESYLTDWNSLARLIRQSVYRRGILTRRELAADWREIFETLGEPFASVRNRLIEVADVLSELGDLVDLRVGKEHGWAKAPANWIALDPDHAVALGAIHPSLLDPAMGGNRVASTQDVPRRFDPRTPESAELIKNVEAIAFSEWLGKPGWTPYFLRRGATITDNPSLQEFWHMLRSKLRESQVTSDDDLTLRLVGGVAGEYFGRYPSTTPEGRWKHANELGEGEYFGARRGYQENDWRFLIAEVAHGRVGRVLPLEDYEEFKWGVIARGLANDEEEKIHVSDEQIRITFPPPKQLERVLNLYGWRESSWGWRLESPLSADQLYFWRSIRPFA